MIRSQWKFNSFILGLAIVLATQSAWAERRRARPATPPSAGHAVNKDSTEKTATPGEPNALKEGISSVVVEGNKKIDREAILEKIGSKVGTDLSDEQIKKDINAVHKLGYFDGVDVYFDSGVLKFVVKERPSIFRIVFFGNEQISTDDLKNLLTIKTYDIFDENLVRESARKLAKHYEEKGFYLAKVDFSIRPAKEKDMVELLFQVREYEKVKIRKITFLGNKAFSDSQLKRLLRNTSEGGFFSWVNSSGNFKELDFKNDLQILQYWYLNEGYVKFKNDPPIVTVSEDKRFVYITIRVDEGQRYNMGTIDFAGDLLFPKTELHDTLTLKETEVFSISKRNADILALTEKYQDLGYANANVVPNLDINDETRIVNTSYEFEKGTLVHYGRINVKGNSKTRDKVIRRELRIHEGELYSGSGMRLSKENVERLGFFENESVAFQAKSPPGRPDILDVDIDVKERATGQFQLGAGYASTTGFFFTTQVAESNFLGKGQDLRFSAQVAANRKNRSFNIGFTDPYAWDTKWSAGGDIYSTVTAVPNKATEFRNGMGLRVGHPLGEFSRLYVGYKLEELKMRDIQDPRMQIATIKNREQGLTSSVTVTVTHDKRNNRMETSSGHYESASEEFAGLGGNRKFMRSILDLRFFQRVWGDLVFKNKIEFGYIWGYSKIGVQSSEKFYLGGPNNLRGYSPFSIGPYEYTGTQKYVNGGLTETYLMSELEYPIAKEVGLKFVLFYDSGDAYDRWDAFAPKQDWGWGFRWFSPMGPLRFEWGYPLKQPGYQFNFMIGQPF